MSILKRDTFSRSLENVILQSDIVLSTINHYLTVKLMSFVDSCTPQHYGTYIRLGIRSLNYGF